MIAAMQLEIPKSNSLILIKFRIKKKKNPNQNFNDAYCRNAVPVPLRTAILVPIAFQAVAQDFVACYRVPSVGQFLQALNSTMVLAVDLVCYSLPIDFNNLRTFNPYLFTKYSKVARHSRKIKK